MWLSESVAGRLRDEKQKAKMISVEIKYNTFQSVSHQKQLSKATNTDKMIYDIACELFQELWSGAPIRLLGIRSSKLVEETEPEQMTIFDFQGYFSKGEQNAVQEKQGKHQKLDKALDQIRKKYGKDAIVRGTLKAPKSSE